MSIARSRVVLLRDTSRSAWVILSVGLAFFALATCLNYTFDSVRRSTLHTFPWYIPLLSLAGLVLMLTSANYDGMKAGGKTNREMISSGVKLFSLLFAVSAAFIVFAIDRDVTISECFHYGLVGVFWLQLVVAAVKLVLKKSL